MEQLATLIDIYNKYVNELVNFANIDNIANECAIKLQQYYADCNIFQAAQCFVALCYIKRNLYTCSELERYLTDEAKQNLEKLTSFTAAEVLAMLN